MKKYDEDGMHLLRVYGLLVLLWTIAMLSIAALTSCNSVSSGAPADPPAPALEAKLASQHPRHDLRVEVNGVEVKGVGVIARAKSYEVKVFPETSIDRIMWRTCNRQEVNDPDRQGFWGGFFGRSQNEFSFTFDPLDNFEDVKACPLKIEVMTQHQSRVGFALVDFEDSRQEFSIKATSKCNGEAKSFKGVGSCQSAAGLIQEIRFDKPVIAGAPDQGCEPMKQSDPSRQVYRYNISAGQCLFLFGAQDGSRFRLNTVGYDTVPYRE